MLTSIGVGFSQDRNPFNAAREAAFLAKTQVKEERVDLLLVFSTVNYANSEITRGIIDVFATAPIVGCSTAAVISSRGVEEKGIMVVAFSSGQIKIGMGVCEGITANQERLSGSEVARDAARNFGSYKRHLFMLISDGLIGNTSELIRGAQEVLGKSFPFVGGTSSDNFSFTRTYQYFQNRVLNDSAIGVLWGGEMNFGLGIKHGWRPLGKPRVATKTEGNTIKTIDHQPAIKIYEDYFGKETQDLHDNKLTRMAILYPIGIYVAGEEEYLLRNTLSVTPDGYLVCQGEIPPDSEIRLMIGSKESCLQATEQAALEAKAGLAGREPVLLFIFDSISRRKLLGREAYKEIDIIQNVFGDKVPLVGFYTLGEDAPLKSLGYWGQTYFHNETVAILALGR